MRPKSAGSPKAGYAKTMQDSNHYNNQGHANSNRRRRHRLLSVTQLPVALLIVLAVIVSGALSTFVYAGPKPGHPAVTRLSEVDQEILYVHLTGRDFSGQKTTLAERAIKCGTPLVGLNFDRNQTNPLLRPLVRGLFDRVNMQASYDSPEGHFKLHYDTLGDSAIKDAGVDLSGALGAGGPDGVPDFINAAGDIFDSVWNIILGPRSPGSRNLAYPLPPSDGQFIDSLNPDSLIDIYFVDFRGSFFGATVPEDSALGNYIPQSKSLTSYIELDNDYFEENYSAVNNYRINPLDAVRVTAAHEFFHVIHFGIDATEQENETGSVRRFWFEMSAVSMEEYQYDDINDYYGYLFNASTVIPFNAPYKSLETFANINDDFPYAMGVFPIWLTDRFGPDVVRGTWLGCGAPGPDFLRAVDSALISFTNGEYDFNRAFSEFGANLALSGERAKFAPPGFGFDEAPFYPTVRDTIFKKSSISNKVDTLVLGPSLNTYPFRTTNFAQLSPVPQSNSNSFVFLHDVLSISDGCFKPEVVVVSRGTPPTPVLTPSLTLVAIPQDQFDTALIVSAPFDKVVVDTNLLIDESALGATIQNLVDSFSCRDIITVDTLNPGRLNDGVPDSIHFKVEDIAPGILLPDPTRYSDVMLIVTQTSLNPSDYEGVFGINEYPYIYVVLDTSVTIQSDPQPFSIRTPYPNPILPENTQVVFEALRNPLSRNSDPITLNVSIFTEAGELVRDNLSATSGSAFTQVGVIWDLTNQSGALVAPGVYIVLQKLLTGPDETALSEVTKVLVIR